MINKNTKFPIDTSTTAHQVKGNSTNSDFRIMKNIEISPHKRYQ